VKAYLQGRDPNTLSLTERERVLTQLLMRNNDPGNFPEPHHVRVEDIINAPKHHRKRPLVISSKHQARDLQVVLKDISEIQDEEAYMQNFPQYR
jgi:hypothetical protein